MRKFIKYYILVIAVAVYPAAFLLAQDDSQSDLRENPEMESDKSGVYVAPSVDYPSFIKIDKNVIDLNGADWAHLVSLIDSASSRRINIVHVGDSHLQADMATAVTRNRLGDHYGSAGRSLIVPFRLAGTNEPVDYSVKTESSVEQSRLLKTPWPTAMGFTGIAVRPLAGEFSLDITALQPFDSIAIYYTGENLCILNHDKIHLERPGLTTVALDDTCSVFSLKCKVDKAVDIHGFNLIKGKTGVAYHVIGNNGATFGAYNGINGFPDGVAALDPSLIIISLGTNEAFGKVSDIEMKKQIHTLVSSLKASCPSAFLLLTTPSECQRRTYRGKGRRRRNTGFVINANVKRLRNVILDYSKEQNIPVYDFYAIAGGEGSSVKWLNSGNMNKDRIHLLRSGYTLQGHLFTDALENAFSEARKK